ncbi:prepilin-type N-terminal cleavage/methylation domain-containing protein, partial [Caminibacter sp.]
MKKSFTLLEVLISITIS